MDVVVKFVMRGGFESADISLVVAVLVYSIIALVPQGTSTRWVLRHLLRIVDA